MSGVMILTTAVIHADHNVNINTATAKELKTIAGIENVLAERIVEYRTSEWSLNVVKICGTSKEL